MARFRIILMNFGLPLRTKRKIKKVIEREKHYEKKTENSKTHGRTANEKAVH